MTAEDKVVHHCRGCGRVLPIGFRGHFTLSVYEVTSVNGFEQGEGKSWNDSGDGCRLWFVRTVD